MKQLDRPIVHVFHRSYFCGKMLAYVRYKQFPHEVRYSTWREIGDQMLEHTGLRGFPVVELPDGRWMSETTHMMLWFEKQHPDPAVMPDDPVTSFFVRLLEDYADEWMWRPAILSRWQNGPDRAYYQHLFPREIKGARGIEAAAFSWWMPFHMNRHHLYGDGITKQNRPHVWSIYTNTLARLEAIFERQPYLLGDKPCLADFGFFGSMFWHFSQDPAPSRIMHETAPGVNEWVGRIWNAKGAKLGDGSFNIAPGQLPPLWGDLIDDVCKSYLPYLDANAKAYAMGRKRFDHTVDGYAYPGMQMSIFRVRCLEVLQTALASLAEPERAQVKSILPGAAWQVLTTPLPAPSDYDPQNIAPFAEPRKVSWTTKLAFDFGGSTPHTRFRANDIRGRT